MIPLIHTLFVAMFLLAFFMLYSRWQCSERQKKTDNHINRLEDYIISQAEKYEELKSIIEHHFQSQKELIDYLAFERKINDTLDYECSLILEDNDIPERFVNIITSGRDCSKRFALSMYFSKIQLTKDIVESESSQMFDTLKSKVNEHFKDFHKIIYPGGKCEIKNLALFLKEDTQIKELLFEYINVIISLKRGDYNGKAEEVYIEATKNFMKKTIKAGIKGREEFNRHELVEI